MSARRLVLMVPVVLVVLVGALLCVGATALATAAEVTGPPNISGESLTYTGTTSATVGAEIETNGLETAYGVRYGTTSAYGSETAVESLLGGESMVSVTLEGLQPNTEYHFRFVAMNHDGAVQGADLVFTTYPAGELGLPNGRVYEMVTPPENHDADVYAPPPTAPGMTETEYPFEAAANGDAVVYVADPTTGGNGNSGDSEGNQYLATRSPQGGWNQVNLEPLGDGTAHYQAFSNNLSTGIFTSLRRAPGEYSYLYARENANGNIAPVFTNMPRYRTNSNDESAAPFVLTNFEAHAAGPEFGNKVVYAGASEDFTRALFEANDDLLVGEGSLENELNSDVKAEVAQIGPLIKEQENLSREYEELGRLDGDSAPATVAKLAEREAKRSEIEAVEGVDDRNELYVSAGGSLSLVNVLPDGKVAPGATFGGPAQGKPLQEAPDFSHVISADGSRVFWSSLEYVRVESFIEGIRQRPTAVFVREDGTRTVQVSKGPAEFLTASADGGYAYYMEAGKLWRFDVENETREELAGSEAGVQGVVAVNETGPEGAYVYFVAHEKLTEAKNSAGRQPVVDANNLYVDESDPASGGQQKIVFIGTLSEGDGSDWSIDVGHREAEATPSGEALVFMSSENLTDGSYPGEGSREEVYVFDAHDGSVFCASCRAQANGGILPVSNTYVSMLHLISENGDRVFFNSEAPLVWRDINGGENVYEWERDGSGECNETAGCVYLISGGMEGPAQLIDASANGNDVFFVTRERLSAIDDNEDVNLYDARVGGVQAVSPPACTGTGCQGAPSPPPVFATPASVTFAGVGNFPAPVPSKIVVKVKVKPLTRPQKLSRALKQCRKMRAKNRKLACEAQAHKRYGKKVKAKGSDTSASRGRK